MNKEEILQRIKDEVARLNGYHKMEDCTYQPMFIALMDAVAQQYAIAMCREQKRVCSEEALIEYKDGDTIRAERYIDVYGEIVSINRQSILKAKNVAE